MSLLVAFCSQFLTATKSGDVPIWLTVLRAVVIVNFLELTRTAAKILSVLMVSLLIVTVPILHLPQSLVAVLHISATLCPDQQLVH